MGLKDSSMGLKFSECFISSLDNGSNKAEVLTISFADGHSGKICSKWTDKVHNAKAVGINDTVFG
jgi:hypothetical protein